MILIDRNELHSNANFLPPCASCTDGYEVQLVDVCSSTTVVELDVLMF